jgi:hypothetical protein
LFKFMRTSFDSYVTGGWVTAVILFAMAIPSAIYTRETFGKDLDFVEV